MGSLTAAWLSQLTPGLVPALASASPGSGERVVVDLLVVLMTASLVALAAQRARIAVIPAYLIAGALVGPGILGLVRDPQSLESIGRLAIILLMFGIGLHLDLASLRHNIVKLVGGGVASVILCVVIGMLACRAFGYGAAESLVVAMALSLSSTAVALRVLADRRELHQPTGRVSVAVLVLQDLAVVAMLAALPAIVMWRDGGMGAGALTDEDTALDLLSAAGIRIAGVTGLIVVGHLGLPRLLKEAARSKSTEVLIVLSVAIAIAASVAMHELGFPEELGAFLAGFLLSSTPFRHQLSGQIGPARDLFIAVFFTTIGMTVDPAALAPVWPQVLIATAVCIALKSVGIAAATWLFGVSASVAVAVGVGLSQGGEFSIVLLQSAHETGLLSDRWLHMATAVVVLTLILTPTMLALGRALAPKARGFPSAPWARSGGSGLQEAQHEGVRARVVIGGFGPVGRAVAEELDKLSVPYSIIEMNPQTVRTQSKLGRRIIFGDIGNPGVLESAGLLEAEALALTIPDDEASMRACAMARKMSADLYIALRMGVSSNANVARGEGADKVVIDELATAQAMQRAVLERLRDPRAGAGAGPAGENPKP
ncbi:MAG: cation:proton antiporter [Phycisphaeraceae bacterium]|nr:cation:proton antiporter [Phycisphaeraceae bacterium]